MTPEPFAHAVTRGVVIGLAALLAAVPLLLLLLQAAGRLRDPLRREIWVRYRSWLILVPAMLAPVLLGREATICAVAILSLLCLREFSRATGLFRQYGEMAMLVLGVGLLTFAALDHWYNFFLAIPPLMLLFLCIIPLAADRPEGYIQRVALSLFAFLLFGVALGHLGFLANDARFRPVLLVVLLTVELNDIFAFCCGKLLGRHKLAPRTSPNKTVEGAVGALVLTTALTATLFAMVFDDGPLAHPLHAIALGAIIGAAGQLGDLVLSSIKRDLGVKDLSRLIPGHGGLLDRFDSLLLVAPAVFHYIAYFDDIGAHVPTRILTGL